MQDRDIVTMER